MNGTRAHMAVEAARTKSVSWLGRLRSSMGILLLVIERRCAQRLGPSGAGAAAALAGSKVLLGGDPTSVSG